ITKTPTWPRTKKALAYAQVLASLPSMRQSIRETENALCLMLNQPAQEIERGVLEGQQLPTEFSAGIPLQLLSTRPDVKAAEMSLAASYYDTNSARAADRAVCPGE
ncbi:hypothetical protein PZH42_27865, partial [Bacteroides cellulosilyticus]|nr:hypothetical protein [Bacteroides cellulosilyticus]